MLIDLYNNLVELQYKYIEEEHSHMNDLELMIEISAHLNKVEIGDLPTELLILNERL